ncbi:hypothetical protein GCM10011297_31200 [Bacterioplanes sanyensis]|uniref:ABC transporter substrate-binding protein n=1 Tax=Bacterioplanes sanyensis TaxID=1249553 RepID=UPI0016797542|nr:ABC transporter substrate-binding protein [Bacterioplanes sanyensis]GGY56193.1 hypothetical protein GCM10011297_31200 [Bacterioplanes sanyensis]
MKRLLLLSLIFALLACSTPEPPLRIGSNVWPGYEALYLARHHGHFNKLPIKLVELASASDLMDGIRNGQLDGGGLTLDEVLLLASEGIDMTIVALCDISAGADVVMARPGINNLAALAGKTIAAETTAVGAVMLAGALRQAGLSEHQVRIVHMPLADQLPAYQRGEIDAAVSFEPFKTHLQQAGAQVLFDSRQIAGDIVDVLALRSEVVAQKPYVVQQLVRGYLRANYLLVQGDEAALAYVNRRLRLPPERLPMLFEGMQIPSLQQHHHWLRHDAEVKAAELAPLLYRKGLLRYQVERLPQATTQFLPELRP